MAKYQKFWQGSLLMLPLSLAVIPWGILAGSVAVEAGLDAWQAQGLSLFVFAGAAQIIATAMIKVGASIGAILLTTLIVTSRHLLYSMALRQDIKNLPFRWRVTLGFLLTDELFAIANMLKINTNDQTVAPSASFDRWYALGAGLSFYIIWNIASLVGIFMGSVFPDLDKIGLDFAIVGTFIAITIPSIVNLSIAVSVLVALVLSVVLQMAQVEGGLLIASLLAMLCGFLVAKWRKEPIAT